MNKKYILTIFIFALSPLLAIADETPTDNDLRANYCLAVKQKQYNVFNQPISSEMQKLEVQHPEIKKMRDEQNAKMERDIKHLKAYIAMRFMSLDPLSLQIAYKSGQYDIDYITSNQVMSAMTSCISKKCGNVAPSEYSNCSVSNMDSCAEELHLDARKRIMGCNDLSWLPF
jgi:hypothetical protein